VDDYNALTIAYWYLVHKNKTKEKRLQRKKEERRVWIHEVPVISSLYDAVLLNLSAIHMHDIR